MMGNITKLSLLFSVFMLLAAPSSAQTRTAKPDFDALVNGYTAAWRESDPVKREKLLAAVWAPNGVYSDPQAEVKGRQKLAEHIGLVMQLTPSSSRAEISSVESQHGTFRFAWRSVMPDGTLLSEGMDFGEVDSNGRIRRLVVFIGPLVPRFEAK